MAGEEINNSFYEALGERWYTANDHPIALLRKENEIRTPWVIKTIASKYQGPCKILDIGCGAGLLSNPLVQAGHKVTGVDLSPMSLTIAREQDLTRSASYILASAEQLPFADESFDVAIALDLLEHVENPLLVIQEARRVLKPGGRFFFHTFNRNFLSWLLVIKGVEWAVRNTPPRMHVYNLFIKPKELREMCASVGVEIEEIHGLSPKLLSPALPRMLLTRRVPENFKFQFTRSLVTGYIGYGQRQ
ncbi:MAG: 3-demethylubiquinone-9 3-O-methyltransferase [Chlamydiales bacterium]|nr:3-demethylubiquinone-9 3-O-methyltransferase [Chlamydiales bacterium]